MMGPPSIDFIFDRQIPFSERALTIFEYQQSSNKVYASFCNSLGVHSADQVNEIPLLPVEAFRDAVIISSNSEAKGAKHPELYFQSSGTSGMERSRHYVALPEIYRESVIRGFSFFYDPQDIFIWAYTPGYNDNPHSSLIWMLKTLVECYEPGFSRFLKVGEALDLKNIQKITGSGKKLMLFGAAFGLIDLADEHPVQLPEDSVIIETGGMKTHRRELNRNELQQHLSAAFGIPVSHVHSEYGMTELLSQAYSLGDQWFRTPPWMEASIRDPKDPMQILPPGQEGLIGVVDLANLYSCSFLLTGDRGVADEKGRFRVLGRWNPENLRGCNFMVDQE